MIIIKSNEKFYERRNHVMPVSNALYGQVQCRHPQRGWQCGNGFQKNSDYLELVAVVLFIFSQNKKEGAAMHSEDPPILKMDRGDRKIEMMCKKILQKKLYCISLVCK